MWIDKFLPYLSLSVISMTRINNVHVAIETQMHIRLIPLYEPGLQTDL